MDRLDRLTGIAKEKAEAILLWRNSPYMGKSFRELLSMMHEDAAEGVPDNGTIAKDQYNVALLEAYRKREKRVTTWQSASQQIAELEAAAEKTAGPDPMEAFNRLYYGGADDGKNKITNWKPRRDPEDADQNYEYGGEWSAG